MRSQIATTHVWSAVGAAVVMGEHTHLRYTLAVLGLAPRQWVCAVQAGTAVSSRTRMVEPNSVSLVRWGQTFGGSEGRVQPHRF